eukprot:COSAG06_NODE_3669_length_5040_cov_3.451123_4_plen_148_part_00
MARIVAPSLGQSNPAVQLVPQLEHQGLPQPQPQPELERRPMGDRLASPRLAEEWRWVPHRLPADGPRPRDLRTAALAVCRPKKIGRKMLLTFGLRQRAAATQVQIGLTRRCKASRYRSRTMQTMGVQLSFSVYSPPSTVHATADGDP